MCKAGTNCLLAAPISARGFPPVYFFAESDQANSLIPVAPGFKYAAYVMLSCLPLFLSPICTTACFLEVHGQGKHMASQCQLDWGFHCSPSTS